MADIKALLKEARKFIDDKKYKEAQECCKDILRKDKQNYFGLVLLGKSLQDSDQAPLAYQKAIASKRDNPLAWQGLAHYYESKEDDESKCKLINIYDEMLYLPTEEEKTLELLSKLGQLGCTLKSSEAVSALGKFMKKVVDNKIYKAAETQFFQILKADIPCKTEDIPLVVNLLTKINNNDPSDLLQHIQCKVILQRNNLNSAIEELTNLPFFSSNAPIRDFTCKSLCIKYVENNMSFNGLDIEKYVDNITSGIQNLKYPSLLKSMVAYDKGLYPDAYKECVPLVNYQEADVTEATFIVRCALMLKKWSVAQKLATNFITKAKTEKFTIELRKFLIVSLAKQQKWKQAIANAKLIPLDTLTVEEKVCLSECYIETGEPAVKIMEQCKETEHFVELQALLLLKQGKYGEAVNLLQESSDNALLIFYLGKAYWELKEYDKSLINLLKAAKLNPDHAETFLYLGHFYYNQKNDLAKAKKCYEKAHNLNNTDIIIAKSLSDTYIKLQQSDADFDLLISLTKNLSIVETWVHFRLGLQYLNKRDWENAIINFRNVIKSNQNDTTAFECLADAYYTRGSYTSALRAYKKVMSMDPSKASHYYTKIGYIHCLLTQYDEAIKTFEKVFQIDPNSHLALKGIAETWIRIAKKKVTIKLHGSARDCAQNAINYIIKAIKTQNNFTCFWKLLADTLLFIVKLPNQYAHVYMPDLTAASESIKTEKFEIIPQLIACYSHIAKQKQQVASYDLAYAYFCYYQESKNVVNANISYNLITVCIKERPNCWKNWNLLGKICLLIKKYELSQHCFIKALQVSRKGSVAKIWCNLGTLYLKLKLYKLSNYCFWRGQSTMPSYPQSWIGQAFIAEAIREEEAMDLFRHASRLGYHPESCLGYADWVCRTLKDNKYSEDAELKYVIEGLYAIPYAMDLVEWFCNFEPNNACACNILGVLQEHSGQLMPAMKSYENAFRNGNDSQKNIVLLNIGRLLVRLEKYEEAVKVYKAITEASFNSTIGLALALFKNGKYEESYSVYDTVLHWLCRDENEKADVLVAMAGIVYMYKGMDDAKTILFQSIQTSQAKPTPYSLYSVCALGLTHSEQSLSKLAASELKKFDKEAQYGYDIGFLKSYFYILDGNVNEAIKVLSDSIHDHPSNAHLWFCMAQYCLRIPDSKAKAASNCAQKTLCFAKNGNININLANIIASASIAEHLAGDHKEGLTLAKEGLHMYPNQAEIWAALLFSLLSDNVWTDKKSWMLTAAGNMRRHLNISRPLSRWASLLEKKLSR